MCMFLKIYVRTHFVPTNTRFVSLLMVVLLCCVSVTRLPVSYKGNYQHVGLKLMLPHFRGCIRKSILGQPYSKLNYVQSYEFPKRYFRALRENFFINMGYPWLIRKRHSLNEHHKRMVYLREKKKENEEDSLTGSSIEQLYEKIVLNNNN